MVKLSSILPLQLIITPKSNDWSIYKTDLPTIVLKTIGYWAYKSWKSIAMEIGEMGVDPFSSMKWCLVAQGSGMEMST